MNSNGEIDQLTVPASRQSRRPSNESNRNGTSTYQTPTKQTITPQKYSGDSGVDSRYSASPADINQQTTHLSTKLRSAVPNAQIQTPYVHETITKERINNGKSILLDFKDIYLF
jgi:hypothetical protein